MKGHKRIKELAKLLDKSIRQTLQNVQEDSASNPASNNAVYLEAWLAHLFIFDYIANANGIKQEFRQNFLEQQFNEIERNYLPLINTKNPLKTVENRFNMYAEIPMHNEHRWYEVFIQTLHQHLQGSQNNAVVLDSYEIPDTSREMLKTLQEGENRQFKALWSAIPSVIRKKTQAEKAWNNAMEVPNNTHEKSWLQRLRQWVSFK